MSIGKKLRCWMLPFAAGFFLIPVTGKTWHMDERATSGASTAEDQPQAACRKITDITAKNTPVDLYPSVAECVRDEHYADAAKIMVVALMFGRFDKLRVPDETTHDVVYILQLHYVGDLPTDKRLKLADETNKIIKKGSPALNQLCKDVRRIGHPTYHPAYMIDHGMGSFTSKTDGKDTTSFDSENAWDKLMVDYLHCE